MTPNKNKKKLNVVFPIFTLALIAAGIFGATLFTPKLVDIWDNLFSAKVDDKQDYRLDSPSNVLPIISMESAKRQSELEAIASSNKKSLDRARARYLLADNLLENFEGGPALAYLEGLEKEYSILAPQIILKTGRAYELTNDKQKAQKIWLKLTEKYPDSPFVADALYKLGESDQKYWQDAIKSFPTHPSTHDIAYKLLEENPQQLNLLLLLAQYDPSYKSNQVLQRLEKEFASELKPENWQVIGDAYWEKSLYKKASEAYEKAPETPQNLYRLARGYHVSDEKAKAKSSYQKLIKAFPDSDETGLGLRRIATITQGDEAISYLDQAINKFPEEAPLALAQKAAIQSKLGRSQAAKQTRDILLQNYSNSEPAANYRWQVAQGYGKSGNYLSAWQWAQQIVANNPDSSITPKAGFWIGKWAQKLQQNPQAKEAFEYVIVNHPESYYAWRSAVQLKWDVGDFKTVRDLTPDVIKPEIRPIPPSGSIAFKELFLLGQDRDAFRLFVAETADQQELTSSEQFTKGLLEHLQGNHLQAISLIWGLKNKDNPQDVKEWQILRQSPEYWQALFPFPYEDIILKWSQERKLNPLLVTSLIRQESRFQPKIKSSVGATGLMQVMPATGKFVAEQINLKDYSLVDPEDNVTLGTWYLDYTHRNYNGNSMLAVASYNAGPGNVSNWVKKYNMQDLDEFVENIPFAETKGYVETVFGNYWNYLRIYNPEMAEKIKITN